jgi:DNA mismatch repair protein MutL
MSRIARLPSEVSQKIAAGEVIERPFSVVKELVENSLDAGAAEVRVELLAGGKKLIRVVDDGSGMSREDAELCFERHATSKLRSEEDLERISTLGFRGEALASISAVSDMVLKTSDGLAEQGTRVERKAGQLVSVTDAAFPRGTAIEVKDIFYNLPARRKFLRSEQSELGHIARFLSGLALAYPEVRFSLLHGRREIMDCPRVGSYRERIFQLFGKEVLDRLIEVNFKEGERSISGHASRPPRGRADRAHQYFFINRRLVKDRVLQAALNQGYRGFLEKDRFPEAFLFLTLAYDEVDVNVHPTKAEVRFREPQFVFHLLLKSLEAALLGGRDVKEIYPRAEEARRPAGVGEAADRPLIPALGREDTRPMTLPQTAPVTEMTGRPRVLGQYLDMYIVAAGEDGLVVIDQHNAHERVLFERYREIDAQKKWPRQMPLIPILIDLSPAQVVSFEEIQTLLEDMGFRAEAMGGRTYALNGFPDIFGAEEASDVFLRLLDELKEEGADRKREKMLATLACKTAVKAHEPLAPEKMDYLVEELFRTSNPALCPHGRPIIVRIGKAEIEKGLKRNP